MKDRLKEYLERAFSGAADTTKNHELKEEILSNLYEKYDGFIEEGMDEESAYQATVNSIGDLSSLFDKKEKTDVCDIDTTETSKSSAGMADTQNTPPTSGKEAPDAQYAPPENDEEAPGMQYAPPSSEEGASQQKKTAGAKSALKDFPARRLFIAISVLLYVCSIIPTIIFDSDIGAVFMFFMIASATFLLISTSFLKDPAPDPADEVRYTRYKHKMLSSLLVGIAVALYIICPTPTMIFNSDLLSIVPMFVLIACATAILILHSSIAEWKYPCTQFGDIPPENPEGSESQSGKKSAKEKKKPVSIAYRLIRALFWIIVTGIYFSVSIITGKWWITWLIFVLAGFLSGVIGGIYKLISGKGTAGPIVQIVICSLFLVALVPATSGLFRAEEPSLFPFSVIYIDDFDDSDYNYGDALLPEEDSDIEQIDIEWVSGKVTVEYWDSDRIAITELDWHGNPITDTDNMLRWRLENQKLRIRSRKWKTVRFFGIGSDQPEKQLLVQLPRNTVLGDLDIEAVSASVQVNDLKGVSNAKVTGVSGNVTLRNCEIYTVKMENVSGALSASGKFHEVKCDTVSGSLSVVGTVRDRIKMQTVSGNGTLTLSEDVSGFELEFDTVSGNISIDRDVRCSGDVYHYGDESLKIDFESVSGGLTVSKASE